jgi:hypothetical protein
MRRFIPSLAFLISCAVAVPTMAIITEIGQFSGTYHENFDEFPSDTAVGFLNLFNNQGKITIEGDNNSIKLEFSSSLGGDLVTPISRLMCGQLGIADWDFPVPATRFGGFWENNSHADDATAQFFDAQGNLFDTRVVPVSVTAQHWQWNGWDFGNTPVSRIRVTGNGLINGFIWYDNMELSVSPEPALTGTTVVAIAVLALKRRRRVS